MRPEHLHKQCTSAGDFKSTPEFLEPPLPHEALVQHRTSAGVPGQAPVIEVPPPLEQVEVEIQTPVAPPEPVQRELEAAG